MTGRAYFRALGQRAASWGLPDRLAFRALTGCRPQDVPYWAFDAFAGGYVDQGRSFTVRFGSAT